MLKYFFALVIMLATLPVSYALSNAFLRYSPVSYFTEGDKSAFLKGFEEALDDTYDNRPLPWSNPMTDAHGYFIPSHSVRQNGVICRHVYIYTVAKKVASATSMKACRVNYEWRVVSAGKSRP